MTTRNELRSFGATLLAGADTLFLGSAFFIYVYRRLNAGHWKTGWAEGDEARAPFLFAVALLVAIPFVYRIGRGSLSAGCGFAAAGCLFWAARLAPDLVAEGGSRAPLIAYVFFTVIFAVHASVLAIAGVAVRGSPIFRRLLWLQAGFAALVLPIVFTW